MPCFFFICRTWRVACTYLFYVIWGGKLCFVMLKVQVLCIVKSLSIYITCQQIERVALTIPCTSSHRMKSSRVEFCGFLWVWASNLCTYKGDHFEFDPGRNKFSKIFVIITFQLLCTYLNLYISKTEWRSNSKVQYYAFSISAGGFLITCF